MSTNEPTTRQITDRIDRRLAELHRLSAETVTTIDDHAERTRRLISISDKVADLRELRRARLAG